MGNRIFLLSPILEMWAADGWLLWSEFPGLDYFWNIVPGTSGHPGNIENVLFMYVCDFFQKVPPPKFHAEASEPSGFRGEISHMRLIQG